MSRTIWRHVKMTPYGVRRPFYAFKGIRVKYYFVAKSIKRLQNR